jgi:DnaK suppressor protein
VDQTTLERYKPLLLAKRRQVLGRGPVSAGGGEAQDVIDISVADSEAIVRARLRETESHLLRAIDEALKRIARGSFGICQMCGESISRERLDAVPWTRH